MPDLLDPIQFKLLKEWNGELRFIQNFKLKRFSKTNLEEKIRKSTIHQQSSNNLSMIVDC